MLKKILITVLQIALMALVIYGVITIVDSLSFADKYETVPWCVTEVHYGKSIGSM